MSLGEQIILEARSWIGTKFIHQAANKNIGCDCIGLVVGVLKNIGLEIPPDYNTNYPEIPDGKSLEAKLDRNLKIKNFADVSAGDIFLMKFKEQPQHVGFISVNHGKLSVIHSYKNIGKVVEHRLNPYWQSKILKIYEI